MNSRTASALQQSKTFTTETNPLRTTQDQLRLLLRAQEHS